VGCTVTEYNERVLVRFVPAGGTPAAPPFLFFRTLFRNENLFVGGATGVLARRVVHMLVNDYAAQV
jgi:hypothetical protein